MTVRGRQPPSPRLAVGMSTVSITAPLWVVLLFSVVTTRQQAVATALSLPALAAISWIVASLMSTRLAIGSSGRRWAGQIRSVSVFLAPLVLFAIAAHLGQGR